MMPSQNQITTALTLIVVGVWMASIVGRGFFHRSFETPAQLDAVVTVVVGYWFVTRRNGNGGK